jgi:hypothetical protein
MGFKERREKAAITDAIARELIAKEKTKRDAKTARLRAQREAANAPAPKPAKKGKTENAMAPDSPKSREKVSITDAIARDVIAAEKRKRDGKTAKLKAAREATGILFDPNERAALDIWIGKQTEAKTHADAIRLIVRSFLTRNRYLRKTGK